MYEHIHERTEYHWPFDLFHRGISVKNNVVSHNLNKYSINEITYVFASYKRYGC